MDEAESRLRFSSARIARLATRGTAGPRLIPIVFATIGDRVVTAIDDKPKTTTRLKRLDDIASDPRVALLVDHYAEDWTALWWVRADGLAEVIEKGAGHRAAIDLLVGKYEQYDVDRPSGPVIAVTVTRWSGWSAAG